MRGEIWIAVVVGLLAIVGLTAWECHTEIDSGYVGVVKTWGNVSEQELAPGWHWKYPWNEIYPIYVELQSYEFKNIEGTPTKEGTSIVPDIAVQWKLNSSMADYVWVHAYEHDYFKHWITNYFMSITRTEIQRHNLSELYTGSTSNVSMNIDEQLSKKLMPLGIIITDVNFRGFKFSSAVTDSLDKRAAANINVETAQKNKQAMMIEADGIDYWNKKVGASVSDTLNQYILNSGIAKNQNAVFYMNSGTVGSGTSASVLIDGTTPTATTATPESSSQVVSTQSSDSEQASSSDSQGSDNKSPGFDGLFAIAGIAGIGALLIRRG